METAVQAMEDNTKIGREIGIERILSAASSSMSRPPESTFRTNRLLLRTPFRLDCGKFRALYGGSTRKLGSDFEAPDERTRRQ